MSEINFVAKDIKKNTKLNNLHVNDPTKMEVEEIKSVVDTEVYNIVLTELYNRYFTWEHQQANTDAFLEYLIKREDLVDQPKKYEDQAAIFQRFIQNSTRYLDNKKNAEEIQRYTKHAQCIRNISELLSIICVRRVNINNLALQEIFKLGDKEVKIAKNKLESSNTKLKEQYIRSQLIPTLLPYKKSNFNQPAAKVSQIFDDLLEAYPALGEKNYYPGYFIDEQGNQARKYSTSSTREYAKNQNRIIRIGAWGSEISKAEYDSVSKNEESLGSPNTESIVGNIELDNKIERTGLNMIPDKFSPIQESASSRAVEMKFVLIRLREIKNNLSSDSTMKTKFIELNKKLRGNGIKKSQAAQAIFRGVYKDSEYNNESNSTEYQIEVIRNEMYKIYLYFSKTNDEKVEGKILPKIDSCIEKGNKFLEEFGGKLSSYKKACKRGDFWKECGLAKDAYKKNFKDLKLKESKQKMKQKIDILNKICEEMQMDRENDY